MGHLLSAPANQKSKITHVIFDLDGTLIDSEEQYLKLQTECLAKFGKKFDVADKQRTLGRTNDEEIRGIIKQYELNVTEDEYHKVSSV
jgi:beta-phosphoglucomutase-like phosphatase (HAD superfamily)